MTTFRRYVTMVSAGLVSTLSAAAALAQQQGSGGSKPISGKNYVWESIIVVLLFGAAIFAVCRSSRRS